MRDRHEWHGQEGYRTVRIDRKRIERRRRMERRSDRGGDI
jgi:hypothetical protein